MINMDFTYIYQNKVGSFILLQMKILKAHVLPTQGNTYGQTSIL
uniref:Uncharacterized protein n=1 Tax=Lepeophtheirus salmonis TaxID=72036 RepID=A0A0K2UT21_LEPSM